jgi:hypothetical protein
MVRQLRPFIALLALATGCIAGSVPNLGAPVATAEHPAIIDATTYALVLPDGLCSAVAVGPRTARTAAHCLFDNDNEYRPPLVLTSADLLFVTDPAATLDKRYDAATITLAETEVGGFPVWAELGPRPVFGQDAWVAGYGCSGFKRLEARPARYVRNLESVGLPFDDYLGNTCPGDSGGGVFNAAGQLIGTLDAKGTGRGNAGHMYAAPLSGL